MERLQIFPKTDQEKQQLLELDELEGGYPRMTLAHLYDMVRLITAHIGEEADPYLETQAFSQKRDQLKQIINQVQPPKNIISWRAVMGKIGRVKRLKIFDVSGETLDYQEMLKPGKVSIVDLSDTDSPQINNLVIAQLLRGVQRQQEENYSIATKENKAPTPVMIFIEEAHEFLSAHRIAQMPRPTDTDLDRIDTGGFVRTALNRLRSIQNDTTNPNQTLATGAIELLYEIHTGAESL